MTYVGIPTRLRSNGKCLPSRRAAQKDTDIFFRTCRFRKLEFHGGVRALESLRRSKLAKELGLDEHEDYVDAWFVYQIEEGLNRLGESITEREMKALRVKTPPLQNAESKNDLLGAFSAAAVGMEAVAQILGQDGAKRWVEKVHRALSAAFEADLKFGRDHEDLSQVVPLDFSPKGTARLWLDMHDGYNDYYFAQRGLRPALVGPVNTWFRREGARLSEEIASGAAPSATSRTASAGCVNANLELTQLAPVGN